jgi:hypothetical protein
MFLFTAYCVKDNRASLAERGVPRSVLSRGLGTESSLPVLVTHFFA